MASLIETMPLDGLELASVPGAALVAVAPGPVTSVQPFAGQEPAAARALARLGLGWPGPGEGLSAGGAACFWTGLGQAFLTGAEPPRALAAAAALTDQGDAWAVMRLEGPRGAAVLARLVPLDLRAAAFPTGRVARSAVGHMAAILRRTAPAAVEIWVFRSMAATAVTEIGEAMARVAARG